MRLCNFYIVHLIIVSLFHNSNILGLEVYAFHQGIPLGQDLPPLGGLSSSKPMRARDNTWDTVTCYHMTSGRGYSQHVTVSG